ncbi:MAG: BMC domain-containing protein [Myxococcales bacterium]|nr:BMC domain-containing protein [Myxococcales bacterium]
MADVDGSPALGILELEHVARGVRVADAICKRTEVEILACRPISGGKHLIYLRGGVAEMEEAMDVGREIAGDSLIDSLFLPMADLQLWPAIPDSVKAIGWTSDVILSAGIVETSTICALLGAMDAACKVAEVTVRDVRLGVGIMGKAFFTMTGNLDDVQAAAEAARDEADQRMLALEVIPAPANEIVGMLIQ